jgi:hypothetical protein
LSLAPMYDPLLLSILLPAPCLNFEQTNRPEYIPAPFAGRF